MQSPEPADDGPLPAAPARVTSLPSRQVVEYLGILFVLMPAVLAAISLFSVAGNDVGLFTTLASTVNIAALVMAKSWFFVGAIYMVIFVMIEVFVDQFLSRGSARLAKWIAAIGVMLLVPLPLFVLGMMALPAVLARARDNDSKRANSGNVRWLLVLTFWILLVAGDSGRMWLPREQITVMGQPEPATVYVLEVQDGFMTTLSSDKSSVRIYRTEDVTARSICHEPLSVFQRVIYVPIFQLTKPVRQVLSSCPRQ